MLQGDAVPDSRKHALEGVPVEGKGEMGDQLGVEHSHVDLIEGCYQDRARHPFGPDRFEDGRCIQIPDSCTQKEQIRIVRPDRLHCVGTAIIFPHYLKSLLLFQEEPDVSSGARVTVHNEHADLHRLASSLRSAIPALSRIRGDGSLSRSRAVLAQGEAMSLRGLFEGAGLEWLTAGTWTER